MKSTVAAIKYGTMIGILWSVYAYRDAIRMWAKLPPTNGSLLIVAALASVWVILND